MERFSRVFIIVERLKLYILPGNMILIMLKMQGIRLKELDRYLNNEFGITFLIFMGICRRQFLKKLVQDIRNFFIILGYQKH
jgi:hypothetical protein